jgi:hypothetical protein
MFAVSFLILALGVLVTFLACIAMFIEEAFAPGMSMVRQEAARAEAANDSRSAKRRQRTARRNESIPRRWALHRQVGTRRFST